MPVSHRGRELAILWSSAFDDIHLGENFDTAVNSWSQSRRQRNQQTQTAINTDADQEFFFVRFKVDIAGTFEDGAFDDLLNQIGDRSLANFGDRDIEEVVS